MLCIHSMMFATSKKTRGAWHVSRLHVRIPARVQRPCSDWHTSPAPPSTCPAHVSPRVLRAHSSLSLRLKESPTRVRMSWSQLVSCSRVTMSRVIRGWNTWLSLSTRQPESQHVAPDPLLNTCENWESQSGRHAELMGRPGNLWKGDLSLTSSSRMRTAASKESLRGENWGCLMIWATKTSVKFCSSGERNPDASNSPSLTFNLLRKRTDTVLTNFYLFFFTS